MASLNPKPLLALQLVRCGADLSAMGAFDVPDGDLQQANWGRGGGGGGGGTGLQKESKQPRAAVLRIMQAKGVL